MEEWRVCAYHVMIGMHALWVVGGSMQGRTGVRTMMTLEVKRLNHEGTCSPLPPPSPTPTPYLLTHVTVA